MPSADYKPEHSFCCLASAADYDSSEQTTVVERLKPIYDGNIEEALEKEVIPEVHDKLKYL
jgi:hypothetical protein